MTIDEVKIINRRKYLLEWQTNDIDGGPLRLAGDEDWGGYFTDYADGLKKFRTTGHLSISTRGDINGQLVNMVVVTRE
tara:strand:+ start:63 stop:296 length:234 start_codon:yes stop_codon:yes gene_type:complete